MDWKAFSASLVGSLAWPMAVVVILLIFKDQVKLLAGKIRKVGAGSVNFELAEKVEEAVEAGKVVETEKGVLAPDLAGIEPTLLQLAKSSPEAAVVQTFKDLERQILGFRQRLRFASLGMRPTDEVLFNMFQLIVLNFAYSFHKQDSNRAFVEDAIR